MHISFNLGSLFRHKYEDLTEEEKEDMSKFRCMQLIRLVKSDDLSQNVCLYFIEAPASKDTPDLSASQIVIKFNACDISNCTEGYLTVTNEEHTDEQWLDECIEYIRKKLPNVTRIILIDDFIEDEQDFMMRSIALNGQSIYQMYYELEYLDEEGYMPFEEYEEVSYDYVSPEKKAAMTWDSFLEKYDMLSEHVDICKPIFEESPRMVDFMRSIEDVLPQGMLPLDVFYKLVHAVVEKEIGKVPRKWIIDIEKGLINRVAIEEDIKNCACCNGEFDNYSDSDSDSDSDSCDNDDENN